MSDDDEPAESRDIGSKEELQNNLFSGYDDDDVERPVRTSVRDEDIRDIESGEGEEESG